jgi:hypothetical protein
VSVPHSSNHVLSHNAGIETIRRIRQKARMSFAGRPSKDQGVGRVEEGSDKAQFRSPRLSNFPFSACLHDHTFVVVTGEALIPKNCASQLRSDLLKAVDVYRRCRCSRSKKLLHFSAIFSTRSPHSAFPMHYPPSPTQVIEVLSFDDQNQRPLIQ